MSYVKPDISAVLVLSLWTKCMAETTEKGGVLFWLISPGFEITMVGRSDSYGNQKM